ncbi:MAG: hypothetical protein HQ514_10455 [Rhodospirillales bacterium]|nr:hypothetical protein [Rhodospirillales bacterium]
MNKIGLFVFAAVLMAASLSVVEQAAAFPCEKEIRAKLEEAKISKPSIASIRVIREMGEEDTFLGYEVWTRVRSCRGQYILSLTDSCYVTSAHSRLSCMAGSGRPGR